MEISDLVRKIGNVDFELTYLCNMNCMHCYNPTHAKSAEFSTGQVQAITEQITNAHEPTVSKQFKADGVFVIHYPSNERAFYYEDCDDVSLSFDLIVRGLEVTSGGIRTVSKESLLRKMARDKIGPARYAPYLKLFDGTVPVHGGFAIGVERIILKYLQLNDISDVILFSKKPNTDEEDLIWKP